MRCEIQRAHALVADVRQIGALAVAGATSGREIGCNTERERERERGEFDETVEPKFGARGELRRDLSRTIEGFGSHDRFTSLIIVEREITEKCRFTAIVTVFVSQSCLIRTVYSPSRIKDRTRLGD